MSRVIGHHNTIRQYQTLVANAEAFYESHRAEIEADAERERADEIRAKIPLLLSRGFTVWCRNGEVCQNATPCAELSCRYKETPSDIVGGTPQCQQFAITKYATTWQDARHVTLDGSEHHE